MTNLTQQDLRTIKWGIIGPGRAAARFAEGLRAVPRTELAAVWGRNQGRARVFAAQFGAELTPASVDELLASSLDAIYIATHADTHAEFAMQALAAGKHVLVEKPAALNVQQVQSIIDAARQRDRLFMEAMKPPFFPLYKRLRQHLQEDPIGPVGFVRAGHCDASLEPDYALHFPELGGGGIMGIGPYEAFLALDWLGEMLQVQCMGRLSPRGVDYLALFQTRHERGMAQLHAGLDLLSRGDALLCGPRAYVLIHANWWNPTSATVQYVSGRKVELHEPYIAGGFNYEIAHFCDLIRDGRRESPEITHALSLGMAKLLEEARRAINVHFPGE